MANGDNDNEQTYPRTRTFAAALSIAIPYASLSFPVDEGWTRYDGLQQFSYSIMVFVAAPVSTFTGLMQGPAIFDALGWFGRLFTRQAMRSVSSRSPGLSASSWRMAPRCSSSAFGRTPTICSEASPPGPISRHAPRTDLVAYRSGWSDTSGYGATGAPRSEKSEALHPPSEKIPCGRTRGNSVAEIEEMTPAFQTIKSPD
jgi:hypothetical protein